MYTCVSLKGVRNPSSDLDWARLCVTTRVLHLISTRARTHLLAAVPLRAYLTSPHSFTTLARFALSRRVPERRYVIVIVSYPGRRVHTLMLQRKTSREKVCARPRHNAYAHAHAHRHAHRHVRRSARERDVRCLGHSCTMLWWGRRLWLKPETHLHLLLSLLFERPPRDIECWASMCSDGGSRGHTSPPPPEKRYGS